MDNFEQLKQLWQQQPLRQQNTPDVRELERSNADNQRKLERTQLTQAGLLFVTAIFLTWMCFFSGLRFQSTLTYVAVVWLILIVTIQSVIGWFVYRRLRRIDVAAPVAQHLEQWQHYYAFRRQLIRLNLPIYYVLLNGALGLYFIEILGTFSLMGRILALVPYIAWMLYAYFVLGKRTLRKENERLESIINNLKTVQNQLIG